MTARVYYILKARLLLTSSQLELEKLTDHCFLVLPSAPTSNSKCCRHLENSFIDVYPFSERLAKYAEKSSIVNT